MKEQRKTTFMEGGNPTLKQAPIFFLILAVFSVELWTFFKNSIFKIFPYEWVMLMILEFLYMCITEIFKEGTSLDSICHKFFLRSYNLSKRPYILIFLRVIASLSLYLSVFDYSHYSSSMFLVVLVNWFYQIWLLYP